MYLTFVSDIILNHWLGMIELLSNIHQSTQSYQLLENPNKCLTDLRTQISSSTIAHGLDFCSALIDK